MPVKENKQPLHGRDDMHKLKRVIQNQYVQERLPNVNQQRKILNWLKFGQNRRPLGQKKPT